MRVIELYFWSLCYVWFWCLSLYDFTSDQKKKIEIGEKDYKDIVILNMYVWGFFSTFEKRSLNMFLRLHVTSAFTYNKDKNEIECSYTM